MLFKVKKKRLSFSKAQGIHGDYLKNQVDEINIYTFMCDLVVDFTKKIEFWSQKAVKTLYKSEEKRLSFSKALVRCIKGGHLSKKSGYDENLNFGLIQL